MNSADDLVNAYYSRKMGIIKSASFLEPICDMKNCNEDADTNNNGINIVLERIY